MKLLSSFFLLLIYASFGFAQEAGSAEMFPAPAGKLFIIGGGKRPPALVQSLVQASGLDTGGYAIILPMASSEPDTAAYYGIRQFTKQGLAAEKFRAYNFAKGDYPKAAIDSLLGARLIYITGGDQNRFMEVVLGSPVYDAIHQAYSNGATIAGTSAGAAVMSRKMITGNEYKHPEYTGDYRTIEAENIEIKEGLGLLPEAIVDQHFVYRMRMNRLITVALENPNEACIGIDESTAILVEGNLATVVGGYQVILLRNPGKDSREMNGLLGGRGLELSVLLPGDGFRLK
ncbi:MAG: cyanophycinase [Lewinellaceae bacterium]|nr:cyanophycinase [Lewinellaceae bacterium]